MPIQCVNCGIANEDTMRFCQHCGTQLPARSAYQPSGGWGQATAQVPPDWAQSPSQTPSDWGQTPGQASSGWEQQPSPSISSAPGRPLFGAGHDSPYPPASYQTPVSGAALQVRPAEAGMRVLSFFIDILCGMILLSPLILISIIPFIGWLLGPVLAGCFGCAYHLLRDIRGASIGKHLFGMRVVDKRGQPASAKARVLRNLPLAIPSAFMIIPFIGWIFAAIIGVPIIIIEAICLLARNERLGDSLAGTMVIKTQ